ncbi:MAG: carboxypeptidase regulatory-like domain-containing protein [Ignavibacteria bacterium]|nr:carboxypeptidase regulatory-like domain-containing protein [Ignavibacteria bacterium]
MNNILKIVLFLNLVLIILSVVGCSEDGSINPTNPSNNGSVTTSISGIVVNENNEPISGVTVSAHGQVKTSGANGEFMFTDISVPQNRFFVKAEKSGYYSATRGDQPKSGGTVVKLTMMPKSVTHTINSTSGGTADLGNGSKVEIQPGSVVNSSGTTYDGPVNMSVVYMDPTDVKFSETVAGGDMMARRSDSTDAILYSYGIMKVEMESPSGEKLNVTGGKPSTITTTIPASLVAQAPSTIPLWYFDENTGLWREEGVATKQGNKYVGTVNHFTDWNNDYPGYLTRVEGKVVDCQNQPMPGIVVKIGQTIAVTDEFGNYVRTVPTGVDFTISVEPTQNFGMTSTPINVPALTNNQVYQVPLCQLSCFPVLVGSFKNCNGENIYGVLSVFWDGQNQGIMATQSSGFRVYVAPNKQARLKFTSYSGEIIDTVVQTPSSPVTLNLGDLRTCGGQTNCSNSFVITGAGYNNKFVSLASAVSLGIYYTQDTITGVTCAAMDTVSFSLVFPGKTTGLFTEQSGALTYKTLNSAAAKTLTINVTEYGAVGDHIKGTFAGTFMSQAGELTITDGKFCVIRQPDHEQ